MLSQHNASARSSRLLVAQWVRYCCVTGRGEGLRSWVNSAPCKLEVTASVLATAWGWSWFLNTVVYSPHLFPLLLLTFASFNNTLNFPSPLLLKPWLRYFKIFLFIFLIFRVNTKLIICSNQIKCAPKKTPQLLLFETFGVFPESSEFYQISALSLSVSRSSLIKKPPRPADSPHSSSLLS